MRFGTGEERQRERLQGGVKVRVQRTDLIAEWHRLRDEILPRFK